MYNSETVKRALWKFAGNGDSHIAFRKLVSRKPNRCANIGLQIWQVLSRKSGQGICRPLWTIATGLLLLVQQGCQRMDVGPGKILCHVVMQVARDAREKGDRDAETVCREVLRSLFESQSRLASTILDPWVFEASFRGEDLIRPTELTGTSPQDTTLAAILESERRLGRIGMGMDLTPLYGFLQLLHESASHLSPELSKQASDALLRASTNSTTNQEPGRLLDFLQTYCLVDPYGTILDVTLEEKLPHVSQEMELVGTFLGAVSHSLRPCD